MEIDQNQHPDSIWTWKSNQSGAKASLWIPYLNEIEKIKGSRYCFTFNGGSVEADLKNIDCIMIYGISGSLDISFIEALRAKRIPLVIHRRNMDEPSMFLPALRPDANDLLSAQIITRENEIKSSYIARVLVRSRFKALEPSFLVPEREWKKLAKIRRIKDIRVFEAHWSKRYWRQYFTALGVPQVTRRANDSPIPHALNACSMFMSGAILRWVLVHRLSPCHGYLHVGTNYAGLVYDLIEPCRWMIEAAVAWAAKEYGLSTTSLTGASLNRLKAMMDETVYVPATRQFVRRKNTLHGVVLALRAYLIGDMSRLVIPTEGSLKGGRPPKVSYKMPGSRPPPQEKHSGN